MLRRLRKLGWLLVGVAGLVFLARLPLATELRGYTGTPLPAKKAPDFRLLDQYGQWVSLRRFRGRVVLLTFLDSRGRLASPLTALTLRLARQKLGGAANGLVLLAVNVNPDFNTVDDMRAFWRRYGLGTGFYMLTGNLPELRRVWRAYQVGVTLSGRELLYTSPIYLIDPDGRERRLFDFEGTNDVEADAELLARMAALWLP